jgi:hypothetical protein
MSQSNVALDLLIRAVIQQHKSNLENPLEDSSHSSIFSEKELEQIVEALWQDRYSDNRASFQKTVGALIADKVSKA